MYKLLVSSEKVRNELMETKLAENIITASFQDKSVPVYILDIREDAKTEVTLSQFADVVDTILSSAFNVNTVYLDDMSSIARIYRYTGSGGNSSMTSARGKPKYTVVKPAIFFIEDEAYPSTVTGRDRSVDGENASGGGGAFLGVVGIAIAVGIIGLAASQSSGGGGEQRR